MTPLPSEPQKILIFAPMTYPHGDCPITPALKNPHQSQCKQTETFTFKILELNHNLQGDVWGQSSIYFQLPENSKKNLLPIFLHPSCSSAFWDMIWRVINAKALVFQEDWWNVSLCWLLLAQLLLALVALQFLFSFWFWSPFFLSYRVIYDSEWCVLWETDVRYVLYWHSCQENGLAYNSK